jgi:hypothetical protein
MYNPRYIVVVLPSPQGGWGWFRRRCSINVVDTTKLNTHGVLDLVEWTQFVTSKHYNKAGFVAKLDESDEDEVDEKLSPFVHQYLHLDYKRRGKRSKFGRTLAMAALMVEKLNNGEEIDMGTFENTVEIQPIAQVRKTIKKSKKTAAIVNNLWLGVNP